MTEAAAPLRYPDGREALVENLIIGIKGTVLAIDRATGEIVWETALKGDFVNVVLDGEELYAAAKGELYRLDPTTGKILWNNGLKGRGFGVITIAQTAQGNWTGLVEKRIEDEAAAAGATAVI
jgi:hypothetical protein